MKQSFSLICLLTVLSSPVFGQASGTASTGATMIEEIVVIGTRARLESRADELPVPVEVHQDFELARTGEIDLGAALTKLAPSFNYTRLSVGDGALLNAATLRGLAPDQTLVLVNGKRRHSMAWLRVLDGVIGYGTGGTDLRAIPSAAVKRVEVLRDGAAAQYGSDAIAGVINIALKESTDHEIIVHSGNSDGAGGATHGLSYNGGMYLAGGGFLNVTGEWYTGNPIRRNGGNGGFDPNYQDELIRSSSPSHSGRGLFFNSSLPFRGDGELYAFGGISQREGRSSGAYRFKYNYWDGIETGDDVWDFVVPNFINFHERNTHPVYPDGFVPYEESDVADNSMALGWRDTVAGWETDLSVVFGRSRFDFGVSDSINASIGANYLAQNPHATVADVIANAGPLHGDSGGIEFKQRTTNLDIRRSFEGEFETAVAAGLESRREDYQQEAGDEASWSCGLPHVSDFNAFAVGPDGSPLEGVVAACGFQGYPGYSPLNARLSEDNRNSHAAYAEVESSPTEGLSLGAALRTEDYSDAGGQTTGKFTVRFALTDNVTLRGAVSTGFRAPGLSQRRFNSILFVGSDTGLTTTFSANEGHPVARAFGIDSLKHETSDNWSAGLLWRSSERNLRFSVDLYDTKIQDRVVRSQGLDCVGISACDAVNASTATFFFNGVDTQSQGVDVSASWIVPLTTGELWFFANGHTNETEITEENMPARATADLTFADYFGGWGALTLERGQPSSQGNFSVEWRRDDWGTLLRMNHFGEATQNPLDTGEITVDSAQTFDIEGWLDRGSFQVALGINNLFGTLPTELSKTHLSNVLWGIRYPTDTPYGLAGRFGYVRVNYMFDTR
ncbi:MAG: TonB-dependent receptor [Gammaproteobacteria bacterium]|nr:TonB-dependent receptor [Gammaproteobacteria bacterium]